MSVDLVKAFAAIRESRDLLNKVDDELADVIRLVEATLAELRPGLPTDVSYTAGDDGQETHWLSFHKLNSQWRIMHAYTEDGKETPLSDAAREIRADVFKERFGRRTPIEMLILEMCTSMAGYLEERAPLLERARALATAIRQLGFTGTLNNGAT